MRSLARRPQRPHHVVCSTAFHTARKRVQLQEFLAVEIVLAPGEDADIVETESLHQRVAAQDLAIGSDRDREGKVALGIGRVAKLLRPDDIIDQLRRIAIRKLVAQLYVRDFRQALVVPCAGAPSAPEP